MPLEITAELDGAADPVVLHIGTGSPRRAVTGPASDVLAWLTGRSAGTGLRTRDDGPLPELPSWG
jgi:maleylpyruvate isomerase